MALRHIWATIIVLILLIGCSADIKVQRRIEPTPAEKAKWVVSVVSLDKFNSCEEIQSYLKAQEELYNSLSQTKGQSGFQGPGVPSVASGQPSTSGGAGSSLPSVDAPTENFTNVQESGVDEPDYMKIGTHHIYFSRAREIIVVNRSTLEYVGSISTKGYDRVEIFVDGARLIVLGKSSQSVCVAASNSSAPSSIPWCPRDQPCVPPTVPPCIPTLITEVTLHSSTSGSIMPDVVAKKQFAGNHTRSRFLNGHLVLVIPHYGKVITPVSGAAPTIASSIPSACGQIVRPLTQDMAYQHDMTSIVSFDTRNPSQTERTVGILGRADHIYMTNENLYLSSQGVQWFSRDPFEMMWQKLVITKINFEPSTGNLTATAVGVIEGRVKDQWAFKEYGDHLAVATTVWSYQNPAGGSPTSPLWRQSFESNSLWVLKQTGKHLSVAGAVHGFGPNEDIRAVRYVGEIAYVVTFEKTDPLFAFDLSIPESPKLLGELEVPGFSTYLHPISRTRLIGVGFDALDMGPFSWFQGPQVSLFDTSDPVRIQRLDNKVLGVRGSSSEATSNHHAFYYDPQATTLAIPVVELGFLNPPSQSWQYGDKLVFSGALFYQVSNQLSEIGRASHRSMMPPECEAALSHGQWWSNSQGSLDINRVVKPDGRLLTLSRFGIFKHDPSNPSQILQKLQYPVMTLVPIKLECPY